MNNDHHPNKLCRGKVSIIIPCYNSEKFLKETITSILSQDYSDFEIIVVDDCSTDNSQKVLQKLQDKRIKYVKLDQNHGGPSHPRNIGIKESSGEYIALFDSDDVMQPCKVRLAVEFFNNYNDIGMVFTDAYKINEEGGLYPGTLLEKYSKFHRLKRSLNENDWWLDSKNAFEALFYENYIPTSSVVLRRQIFDEFGYFDETLLNGDDKDFWYRLTRKNDIGYIDLPLHKYRVRENSVSKRGILTALNRINVLEKQLQYNLQGHLRKQAEKMISLNNFGIGYIYKSHDEYIKAIKFYKKSYGYHRNLKVIKAILSATVGLIIKKLGLRGSYEQ